MARGVRGRRWASAEGDRCVGEAADREPGVPDPGDEVPIGRETQNCSTAQVRGDPVWERRILQEVERGLLKGVGGEWKDQNKFLRAGFEPATYGFLQATLFLQSTALPTELSKVDGASGRQSESLSGSTFTISSSGSMRVSE